MVGGNPSVGGGGFAASPAGTAPLYYKSAEIASGSAKNLCKKSEMLGGVPCAAPVRPAAVVPAGGGRAEPRRHLLFLPRGRGPSQTPKFLSPGPPSPWLPALPMERRFFRFCAGLEIPKAHPRRVPDWQGEPVPPGFSSGDARGGAPCMKKTLVSPFPAGEGGWGDRGQKRR